MSTVLYRFNIMRHERIGRARVEAGLLGGPRVDGVRHGIVPLQDDTFSAVLAVGRFVLAFDHGEGVDDVVAVDAVEAKEDGAFLAAQQGATFVAPPQVRNAIRTVDQGRNF